MPKIWGTTELQKAPCFPIRFELRARFFEGIDAGLGYFREYVVWHYIDSSNGQHDQPKEIDGVGIVSDVLGSMFQVKRKAVAAFPICLASRRRLHLDSGNALTTVYQEIVLAVVTDRNRRHEPFFESSEGEELLSSYANGFRGWRTDCSLSHKPSGMSESQPC